MVAGPGGVAGEGEHVELGLVEQLQDLEVVLVVELEESEGEHDLGIGGDLLDGRIRLCDEGGEVAREVPGVGGVPVVEGVDLVAQAVVLGPPLGRDVTHVVDPPGPELDVAHRRVGVHVGGHVAPGAEPLRGVVMDGPDVGLEDGNEAVVHVEGLYRRTRGGVPHEGCLLLVPRQSDPVVGQLPPLTCDGIALKDLVPRR